MEHEADARKWLDKSQVLFYPQTPMAVGACIGQLGQPTIPGTKDQDSESQLPDTLWTKAIWNRKAGHNRKFDASDSFDRNYECSKDPSNSTWISRSPVRAKLQNARGKLQGVSALSTVRQQVTE